MLTIRCAKCSEQFDVPDSLAGQVEPCPACSSPCPVPRPAAVFAGAEPDLEAAPPVAAAGAAAAAPVAAPARRGLWGTLNRPLGGQPRPRAVSAAPRTGARGGLVIAMLDIGGMLLLLLGVLAVAVGTQRSQDGLAMIFSGIGVGISSIPLFALAALLSHTGRTMEACEAMLDELRRRS
jgi:hypothetical protein